MGKIAIVTDSTAYLSQELVEKYDITVIPLMVNFGQDSYKEGVTITNDEFFNRLAQEKNLPTTSQPSVGDVVTAYEHLLETHDGIIGIFISAGLSGTAHSAETAARMVGGDISVIDSKLTGSVLVDLVMTAVKMREEGHAKQVIVDTLLEMSEKVGAYFVVDSLEHLHRGGRIGGVSAALGSLLQVKPVLQVTDGKLELFEKVRTRKKALQRAIDLVREAADTSKPITAVYAHTKDDGEVFRTQVAEAFPGVEVRLDSLGPVIGTHVGPGLLGIMFHKR